MKSDLIDLDLDFRYETEKAYAVWNGATNSGIASGL